MRPQCFPWTGLLGQSLEFARPLQGRAVQAGGGWTLFLPGLVGLGGPGRRICVMLPPEGDRPQWHGEWVGPSV